MVLNDVILKVGGEGGSVVLYGLRSGSDWMFSLDFINPASHAGQSQDQEIVDTWEGALTLLDRYQWHRLVPMRIHPDFREQVMDVVRARYESHEGSQVRVPQRWQEADINPCQVKGRVHSTDTWLYGLVDDD